ncbi:beta-galactosidase, partial [Streptomyces sp. NPDC007983]
MAVTRRSLLIAGSAAPLAGTLATGIPAQAATPAPAASRSTDGRSIPLDDGWRFALVTPDGNAEPDEDYAAARQPGYDDSAWRTVAVPHDWSIELTPTTEHGTTGGTGFLPGGLGWYR